MPLRNLLVILLSSVVSLACYDKAQRNRYVSTLTEAMRLINRHYLDEVDDRQLFENAMNGMISGLDQYSEYFGPDSFQQVEESLDQEFGGIGIVVDLEPTTGQLTVMSPLVGSPAYQAGIRAGDGILEIDGASTEGMPLKSAVVRMRGAAGTSVRLLVRRAGQAAPAEFTVQRAVIPIESVLGDVRREDGSWQFYLEEHPRIGYVRVITFGKHTAEELRRTLRFADHPVDALILDLRRNAGGLLDAAVETCDMFLEVGRIVSTRGRGGHLLRQYDASPPTIVDKSLPVAVLTNHYSASASEIVAACLQDHRRAVVVGERTWGKGTVQNIIELENGKSALKLTTASYWRPSGKNIHRRRDAGEQDNWGVRPDKGCEVSLSDEEFQKLMEDRRRRDMAAAGLKPGQAAKQGAANGDAKSEPEAPFEDRQLKKATERLEKELGRARAGSQRA